MKLTDRAKLALQVFRNKSLYTSTARVGRNYQLNPEFNPQRQLKGLTYKVVDKIGLAVSTYEPKVLKANGDYYETHPVYALTSRPNETQRSLSEFVHLWAMLNEIYGESFWYLGTRGERTGRLKEIILLNPSQIELKFSDGELVGYVLHKLNGQQVPLTLEEVYHDKTPNPFNPWRGMSVMEKASTYIDIEIATSRFTLNYMHNNASPSGIVSLPAMEKSAFDQFTMEWREGYEGPENAGKTAFIRGGEAEFKAVGATLRDIDQKITRDMAKDDLFAMFDMPKGLLGMAGDKGMGRSETESLEYIFAKYKVNPLMVRLDRIWQDISRQEFTSAGNIQITHENPIPEDKEFIHQQNKDLINRALTVNEVRARIGLDPIDGGDVITPENATPLLQRSIKKVVLKQEEPEKSPEEFRTELVSKTALYEVKLKRAISKFVAGQEKQVISNINASSKAFEEWLFSVKEQSELMFNELEPLLIQLINDIGKDTVNFITGNPFELTPEIRNVLSRNILSISGVFNTQTLQALEKTLAEGQANGESLFKLKKRVEETYKEAKGYRAERIARTESLRTANSTAEQVYKQNGFNKVTWFTNPGACEFCRVFSGKTKEIGSNYNNLGDIIEGEDGGQLSVDYSDIATPPLHPNCTCSLIPSR